MNSSLLLPTLLLAASGFVGYILRDIPKKIFEWLKRKTLYSVTIYQQDELFDILEDYLFKHYRNHYQDVEATVIYKDVSNDKPAQANDLVIKKELKFKQEENFFVARIGGKKILISKTKEKLDKAVSIRDVFYRKYILKGWRAKNQINQFLQLVLDEHNAELKKRGVLRIFTNDSYGNWCLVQDKLVKSFKKVVMIPEEKEMLINDLDDFVASADWYHERAIPYKRTYCYYGSPGNGKTSIATAMAEYLHRDIYILNLSCLENDSRLIQAFSQLGKNIILLIEDMDRAFTGRENTESKISFSALLNSLDGVFCRDGIVTVITTNHIDKLDEALIRRGRVDMAFEICNPNASQIQEYIEMFYGIKLMEFGDKTLWYNISMSEVQEMCIQNRKNYMAVITKLEQKVA